MDEKKYTQTANYALIGKNKKPKTEVEIHKIPEVKKILLEILEADNKFWESKKQKQQGIERFSLIQKVSEKIKVNSNIIYLALDELEGEQVIIPETKDNKTRYILFKITH